MSRETIRTVEDAQRFQRNLYDSLVKSKGSQAFAVGSMSLQKLYLQKRIDFSLKYMPDRAVVLDIGCGDGTITKAVAGLSQKVVAIDISKECINLAKSINSDSKIEYINCSIEECENIISIDKFDFVMMYETLEHIYQPRTVLRMVNKMLSQDGIICVSTPNCARLEVLFLKFLKLILGRKPRHIISPDHVQEYSFKEVLNFLQDSGFSVIGFDALCFSVGLSQKLEFSSRLQKLSLQTGKIIPSLSHHMYFAARKYEQRNRYTI